MVLVAVQLSVLGSYLPPVSGGVGVGVGVAVGVGLGVGLGLGCGGGVGVDGAVIPPHTIIWLPVQTAV
jgi:hypothetical protein